MSFFNLEVIEGKPTKSIRIMPHLNIFETYVFGTKKLKTKTNCNPYGLMKIWSNFKHSKVPNY
jgi:hypothetical protein